MPLPIPSITFENTYIFRQVWQKGLASIDCVLAAYRSFRSFLSLGTCILRQELCWGLGHCSQKSLLKNGLSLLTCTGISMLIKVLHQCVDTGKLAPTLPKHGNTMIHRRLCRREHRGKSRCALFQTIVTALLLSGCGATQLGMCAPHQKEEGTPTRDWVECFEQPVSHAGITHSVLCLSDGTTKPPVLLLHELTGLSPGTLAYAEELSKEFTVYVPLLFGEQGKLSLVSGLRAYWFRGLFEFFPAGEWGIPSEGSAPIVNWLRGVVQQIGGRHQHQRMGIIGNCMTGPIPLALLDSQQVHAVVIAQPALPMRFWWYTDEDKASLGITESDLQKAKESTAMIYGLRFETDCIAHPEKHRTLRDTFGTRFINGEIPAKAYQIEGKRVNAHSTLIGGWKEHDKAGQSSRDAREKVRTFLLTELGGIRPEGS